MSTFGGVMSEFPDVRVDYFRPVNGLRPPLATFLSHIHSDHRAGLDTYMGAFIYCSAATKELLLKNERKFHRINFQRNVLESRNRQYKHLKNLLRPIPLETPTKLELAPGNEIRVTLFDANHCTGAVMFLFENDKNAVLYTGDICSEPWFVNGLSRNPFLIEYTTGLKVLDCIYLDTSFTSDIHFPTKSEGLKELLAKVVKYPPNTIFHFSAWTFGYEEVWIALSRALKSPIHVDQYKFGLFKALRGGSTPTSQTQSALSYDASVLAGYKCGNREHPGILTLNENVRLHSCEKGTGCQTVNNSNIVWIRPIITRIDGEDVNEMGIGGGGGDLQQQRELEIEDVEDVQKLMNFFAEEQLSQVADLRNLLMSGMQSHRQTLSLDDLELDEDSPVSISQLLGSLCGLAARKCEANEKSKAHTEDHPLPKVITFPYSRHSSYSELCLLVDVFKPKDVFPCTVDKANWDESQSIEVLFGKFCSGHNFRHDISMRAIRPILDKSKEDYSFQETNTSGRQPLVQETLIPATNYQLSRTNERDAKEEVSILAQPFSNASPAAKIQTIDISYSVPQAVRRKSLDDIDEKQDRKRQRLEGGNHGFDFDSTNNDQDIPNDCSDDSDSAINAPQWTEGIPDLSYWDAHDEIFRCVLCQHEMWTVYGHCTGCGSGNIPYHEDPAPYDRSDDDRGPDEQYPRLFTTRYEECEEINEMAHRGFTYHHLDSPSDYESQQEQTKGYEINSFIDDASIFCEEDNNENDLSDDDTDYKKLYIALQVEHSQLLHNYSKLANEHELLTMDLTGSDSDIDEGVMVAVDVETRDPALFEISPSQFPSQSPLDDSQDSGHVLTPERIASRTESYNAVLNGVWENVSLVSVCDNHTSVEAIL